MIKVRKRRRNLSRNVGSVKTIRPLGPRSYWTKVGKPRTPTAARMRVTPPFVSFLLRTDKIASVSVLSLSGFVLSLLSRAPRRCRSLLIPQEETKSAGVEPCGFLFVFPFVFRGYSTSRSIFPVCVVCRFGQTIEQVQERRRLTDEKAVVSQSLNRPHRRPRRRCRTND
jgi:hypothetical protein